MTFDAKAYAKKYREKNREKIQDYQRSWREKNRERLKVRHAKWYADNREQERSRQKAFRVKHRDRLSHERRFRQILKKYGLTKVQFEAMLESQGGVCAICSKTNPNGRSLAIDHCHSSGVVRGLLCGSCNAGLGLLRDDPELLAKCIVYLNERGVVQALRDELDAVDA